MGGSRSLRHLLKRLDRLNKRLLLASIFLLEACIFLLDYITGPLAPFRHFYLLPIWLAGSFLSARWAYFFAFLSASAGVPVFKQLVGSYSNIAIVLDFLSNFIIFVSIAFFSHRWREMLAELDELATFDDLTGVYSRKAFFEMCHDELARSFRQKQAVSLAFIDLDNFKLMNDTQGHKKGDDLLILTASTIKFDLRSGDLIGRLGGDEFAILLHQTDQNQAKLIIPRMKENLLNVMTPFNTNVTFSIGVVSCLSDKPTSVEALLELADRAMYAVKHTTKNSIHFVMA